MGSEMCIRDSCAVVHMNDVVAAEEVNATLQFVGESCNVSFADDGVDNPVPLNPRYHPDRFPTLPPSADYGESSRTFAVHCGEKCLPPTLHLYIVPLPSSMSGHGYTW